MADKIIKIKDPNTIKAKEEIERIIQSDPKYDPNNPQITVEIIPSQEYTEEEVKAHNALMKKVLEELKSMGINDAEEREKQKQEKIPDSGRLDVLMSTYSLG